VAAFSLSSTNSSSKVFTSGNSSHRQCHTSTHVDANSRTGRAAPGSQGAPGGSTSGPLPKYAVSEVVDERAQC
jgi:hypothetical protein